MGKASAAAKNRWNAKNYDRITLFAPKGEKAEFQAAAEKDGKSLNAFFLNAAREKMSTPTPSGWIPTAERLPEIGQEVLVYTASGEVYVKARGTGDTLSGVTHWAALPEPPENRYGHWFHTWRYKTTFDPPEDVLMCSVCGFQKDFNEK